MSFEHKYLKYKQKYLELKQELSKYQVGGAETNVETETSESLNVDKLTETPTFEKTFGMKKDDLVNFRVEDNQEVEPVNEDKVNNEEVEAKVNTEEVEAKVNTEEVEAKEQVGGDEELDTSISELDEIFSQLGGKKVKDDEDSDFEEEDSDDLSSLSELDDDSSDFDF